jgi:hypothetical protein
MLAGGVLILEAHECVQNHLAGLARRYRVIASELVRLGYTDWSWAIGGTIPNLKWSAVSGVGIARVVPDLSQSDRTAPVVHGQNDHLLGGALPRGVRSHLPICPPCSGTGRRQGEGPGPAALGYLHANCGNCHNPLGSAWQDGEMNLRLSTDELTPEDTEIFATIVGVPLERFSEPGYEVRIAPGDTGTSALYYRMSVTSDVARDRMPPLATDDVDDAGLEAVGAWLESLD